MNKPCCCEGAVVKFPLMKFPLMKFPVVNLLTVGVAL